MGILYVVGTPIGNLDDISKRALQVLESVAMIACEDTRVSINLLRHFDIKKKLVSYHKFNECERSSYLIKQLQEGMDIALITDAGCPCISDPGNILVKSCLRNNISVMAIPGPSAVITSLMVSGMDTFSFAFYGFLDREKKKMVEMLNKIKKDSASIAIIYESPKRIVKTLNNIREIIGDVNICLCNDLTKKFEKNYYGSVTLVLEQLLNNQNYELGEYVIVIEKGQDEKQEQSDSYSIEALLVDVIIKEKCTMKEAIKIVSTKYSYNKNIVYDASLHVKSIFK